MKIYKKLNYRIDLVMVAEDSCHAAKVVSSTSAYSYIVDKFENKAIYESFYIMLLNRANNTIGYARISQGGVSGTTVDPKIIAKYAVDSLASSIILVHNHPSGNMQPSSQDINITKKIKDGLKLLEIEVLDHMIISGIDSSYYSFTDEGVL